MIGKNPFLSKTIRANIALAVLARFVKWTYPRGFEWMMENPDLIILAVAAINIILRLVTKEPVLLEVPKMFTRRFLPMLMIILIAGCTALRYRDDLGFPSSAQAESPEFPVYINGAICKDTDNKQGLCSKRITSREALKIEIPAQPYAYKLDLSCTRSLGESQTFDVMKESPFTHIIPPEKFTALKSFICIGEVFPKDRPDNISASWEVRAKIVDVAYKPRESVYMTRKGKKTFLVLGEFARHAWVWDNGAWSFFSKSPVVEIKGDPTKVVAYSESYQMRFNSYGLDAPVEGDTPRFLTAERVSPGVEASEEIERASEGVAQ